MVDLLIDGYNLMHFAGLSRRRYGPGDLERARNRLLKRLQRGLSQQELSRTTVIFDGQDSPTGRHSIHRQFGMRIEYSPRDREADDLIEDAILAHSAPKQLLVISSDHRLHKAARARKAGCSDSEDFLAELERREEMSQRVRQHKPPELKSTDQLSEEELEQWLSIFSEIDPIEIERNVRQESQLPVPSPKPTLRTQQPDKESAPPSSNTDSIRKEKPTDPVDNSGDPPPPILTNDVDFWRERIAELLREEGIDETDVRIE